MGTLNDANTNTSTAAADTLAALARIEEQGIAQVRAKRDEGHDWFWENPKGLTPHQAFALYGTRAWLVILDDLETTSFVNRRCLLDDGTPDPRLAPYMITVGVPDAYVLVPNADGVVSAANPNGFGSVTVRPKLVVVAPAGAAVVINGQTVTADDSGHAVFVLPEGPYAGQATLEGYEGGAFTVTLRRGGDQVESGLTLIPPPPADEQPGEEGGGE